MTSDDDEDRPWNKVIPLTIRSADGSQEPASTLEQRFFTPESKPKPPFGSGHSSYDRPGPFDGIGARPPFSLMPDISVLTQALIDEVNTYAIEWTAMDAKVNHLEDGTGGSGGRRTWLEIAKIASDRAFREDKITFCHYFDVMVSLVMAEENQKLLRCYLADVISVSALWIRKLDSEEQDKPTSHVSP